MSDTVCADIAVIAAIITVATAHITSPCAVSRKNTSWVCVPTHLVRSLPVIYPPIADDTHCITISHMDVVTANVVAVMPRPDQGEIAASPSPEPSAKSANETAVATNAPAMMAGQEAADPARGSDPARE